MINGKVTKVILHGYPDKKLLKKNADFEFPINPESYSRNLVIKNDESQAPGTQGTASRMNKIQPEEIQLDFIFDNTGTVMGNTLDGVEVTEQIQRLLDVAYHIHGKIHEPRRLKLSWGDLQFDCKLTSLSIDYTLFKKNGVPLRAKLSGTFRSYVEDELRERRANNNSPDVSHLRTVTGSDTLDLMTHDIYGNNRFFLQVAKANNLTSPRLLSAGLDLVFPPLEKPGSTQPALQNDAST